MNSIRTDLLRCGYDRFDVEVRCERVVTSDEDGFIGEPHGCSEPILSTMNHHNLDSKAAQRA
jgi:hypothetical protein